jgi:hypothetical protein
MSGILVVIGLTVINTLVTSLLGIDDDDFYYRTLVHSLSFLFVFTKSYA